MRWLRVLKRLCGFLFLTFIFYTAFLLGRLGCRLRGRSAALWRNRVMRFWARVMILITGGKLIITGPIPRPPFVLVCNHLSYVDVAMLYAAADVVFVAKAEVRSWPILGWLIRGLGTIFIDRTRRADVVRVNQEIADQMGDQYGLVIFPEGTSTIGADILPFKPSLLAFPASQGIPVHYATLTYCTSPGDLPAHRAVCWGDVDDLFFLHLLRFFSLKSYEARLRFGPEPVTANDRKALAETLRLRMKAQFAPVVDQDHVSTGG